jgi:Mlc titration factor MtfA (ptsG expression regulator)
MFHFGRAARTEDKAHDILVKHNAFYRKIGPENQKLFRNRVNVFMRMKEWRGGDGLRPTFEQKIAISSMAIQITFGSSNYELVEFHTIIIYPGTYTSQITGFKHRGEVNPIQGVIVLSWKDFLFGNAIEDDHFNVGLHELAHAFYFNVHMLEDEVQTSYDFLNKFLFLSEAEIIRIRQNKSRLFRKYAGDNAAEFFAIAVEYFFEEGENFRDKMPELYKLMCLVLRMDPLRSVYRNLNISYYFQQKNFDSYEYQKEPVLLDKKKTGFRILIPGNTQLFVAYFIIFFAFFPWSYASYNVVGITLGTLMLIAIPRVHGILFRQFIESTENYLLVKRITPFFKSTIAIHYDNMISIDIGNDDSTLLIKYFDERQMKTIYIGQRLGYQTQFLRFLAKRNIMLKNDGKRIIRVKSKRHFR